MNDLTLTHMGSAPSQETQLNKKQRMLIKGVVDEGMKQTEAAIWAGYTEKSAKSVASKLMRSDEGQRYLQILVVRRMSLLAVKGMNTSADLLSSRSDRVRMEVAQDLMDRAGMRAPEKVEHNHVGDISISINLGD